MRLKIEALNSAEMLLIIAKAHYKNAKKHANAVLVKLLKPRHNFWKKHVDKHFAMAVVKQADELAEMFPEDMIFYISQDDKIKVPLRLVISKK